MYKSKGEGRTFAPSHTPQVCARLTDMFPEVRMFQRLLQALSLGCHHRRMSKPFAAARTHTSSAGDWDSLEPQTGGSHYVVCLECGKKFGYDWSQMKLIR